MSTIWSCKIGSLSDLELPKTADVPMRRAVEKAFEEITKSSSEFLFSGWGASLTKYELAVVKNDDNIAFEKSNIEKFIARILCGSDWTKQELKELAVDLNIKVEDYE